MMGQPEAAVVSIADALSWRARLFAMFPDKEKLSSDTKLLDKTSNTSTIHMY